MKVTKISFSKLKKANHNGEIFDNESLNKYTTFKIGGKCKFLVVIKTLENFIKVMDYINDNKIPFFILGNGSNLLVSDSGFNGIVIKFSGDLSEILMKDNMMECGAGVTLAQAYRKAFDNGLSGFEDGVGIPASIGGATFMNASAYNFEMSKIIKYVVAFVDGKIRYFDNESCKFGYRDSIFQHNNGIILRVCFVLEKKEKDDIQKRFFEVLEKRKNSQPLDFPSAGCVFRKIKDFEVGKCLDECGLKGTYIGGAMVSEKHANFIVNFNNATSKDVYDLINLMKNTFKCKYLIDLNCEIRFLGDFDETIG